MKRVIVMSTDQNFLTPAETLIKSIAYHNTNLQIDIINEDIAPEWFQNLNDQLAPLNIRLVDLKFDPAVMKGLQVSNKGLSKLTYGRFLIPELVPEDRVLYLDVDMLVMGRLDELFTQDLHGHPLGVVMTNFQPGIFNAGVLLIDNHQLKGTDFTKRMLERGRVAHAKDDQSILNEVFHDNYQLIPGKYNVQIGDDLAVVYNRQYDHYDQVLAASSPAVIYHFTGFNKPWLLMSPMRHRADWWFYRNLEFSQVRAHRQQADIREHRQLRPLAFTYTTSQDMPHLQELIEGLPGVDIHVAATTMFGPKLPPLLRYPNFHLHEQASRYVLDDLAKRAQIYLDLCPSKDQPMLNFIGWMLDRRVPIMAFTKTSVPNGEQYPGYQIFADDDQAGMIAQVKKLLQQ